MKSRYPIIIVFLAAAMLISLVANVYLFSQARRYYTDLNEARLDPLGLNTYPPDAAASTNNKINVLFYGDSRSANWPDPDDDSFVFLNRGIGAQTSAQIRLRFQYHVAPLNPHIIILQVGINDLKTIPLFSERKSAIIAACEENIRQIVSEAKSLGATVILTTIFPVDNAPLERQLFWSDDVKKSVDEVNNFIHTLTGTQVIIFDTYSLLVGTDGLMQSRYRQDELHINAAGYEALNAALRPMLQNLRNAMT